MQLRPMLMSDADFMLELKNYDETRHFALLTSEEIKKEDHYRYLESNIQHFRILEEQGFRVGAYRIEENELSIWIHRKFRGLGLATKAIKMVATSDVEITAKIVCANIASMRAFIKAGFLPTEYKELPLSHYIFKK